MRVVSAFAMTSAVFFLLGTVVIMQFAVQQPNQWQTLPASTNFTGTIMVNFDGKYEKRIFYSSSV
jgi:hypothetical protein